jgi:basic membrane protein A
VFREDQAGYMAGLLAARVTTGKKVACLGGVPEPPVKRFCNGFSVAAKRECPTCTVTYDTVYSFDDEAAGQSRADVLVEAGNDVLFGAGGLMGSAAIRRASQRGIWVIGVDTDEYHTSFASGTVAGSSKLLSSAVKRVDRAVSEAVKTYTAGTLQPGNTVFSAANQGVGLAPYHQTADRVSAESQAKLSTALSELAAGTLDTGVDLVTGDPK